MAKNKFSIEAEARYERIGHMAKDEIETAFASGQSEKICRALLSMALHEDNWQEAQNLCLNQLMNGDLGTKRCAIIALGHLVRIHHTIDLKGVIIAISDIIKDEELGGNVDDLLDDIEMFYRSSH